MATPKHILRIHDTESNLFANLKDTQIAFATDTNRIIWREGSSFWTFDAGLKWNGTNFEGNEVSTGVIKVYQFNGTEALQIGDGGGNPNLLTTGILTLNADQLKLTLANTTGTADKLLAVTSAGKVVEIDVIAPTMQETYDNSSDPEILTDATRGALTLKRGSSLDSDNVLEVLNGAGTITWAVSGDGVTSFKTTTNGSPTNGDVWSDGTRTNIQGNLAINGTNQGIQGNRGDDDYLYITNRSSVNNGANIKLIDSSVDGEYGNLRIYTTDVLDWYQNYIKSYVPIRFDSTISNPSPINGEIWYDGTNLLGREGSVTGKIAYKNVDNNFSADQTFQGNANIGDVLNLASTTNASPTNGDIWYDSTTTELMAIDSGVDKHTLSVGLGYLNGAVDTISNGDTQTYSKVFRTPATWTGSPYSGANGDNQGYLFNFLAGSSLYGTQLFLGQDGWNQGEAKVRCLNNGTWGDWQNIFISKDGANGVLPLRTATNGSPSNGDIWYDGTNVNVQGDLKVNASNINFTGLPTSSAGLSAGDLWNDSGTLKIV